MNRHHVIEQRSLIESEDMDFINPLELGKNEEIEGSLGELSAVHNEFDVCGHGVAPEPALFTAGLGVTGDCAAILRLGHGKAARHGKRDGRA
ncbi:MAG TPA: hypothetical protein PLS03_07615, partial [Terrimicrobiaceae bacterium]|nr:hypothetical protein [Terrimicrobiaceae bacterium]